MEIKLLDLICGYGEDPGKPVVWASLGITFFALLYSVDILAQGNTLTNSLISGFTLSLQSFATLIFGVDSQTVNTKLRFLTSIEGALSTLLIPFLVFSLTKSID